MACLLILIWVITFFVFQITSNYSNNINANQVELFSEHDVQVLLSERKKLLKGKTAHALDLCKSKANAEYGNNTYQIIENSPTSVLMIMGTENDSVKLHCSISYDTTRVESFHKI